MRRPENSGSERDVITGSMMLIRHDWLNPAVGIALWVILTFSLPLSLPVYLTPTFVALSTHTAEFSAAY